MTPEQTHEILAEMGRTHNAQIASLQEQIKTFAAMLEELRKVVVILKAELNTHQKIAGLHNEVV